MDATTGLHALIDKTKRLTVIFVRPEGFYPIALQEPEECGRSIAQQAADHAELNPGTLRVEDMDGQVLWRVQ